MAGRWCAGCCSGCSVEEPVKLRYDDEPKRARLGSLLSVRRSCSKDKSVLTCSPVMNAVAHGHSRQRCQFVVVVTIKTELALTYSPVINSSGVTAIWYSAGMWSVGQRRVGVQASRCVAVTGCVVTAM
jgi:hypothetical protein